METGSHENASGVGEAAEGEDDVDGAGRVPEQLVRRRKTAASAPIHRPVALIEFASFHPAEGRTTRTD
jgi:hypothetical protein